jgi:preprotein translocase subunit YajC
MLLFGMLLFFGFLMVTTMLQGRKEKKKKAELLSSIARHDRVQTVGGIIGTVAELTDTEAVLRVDESTNSRVRVTRSSIQTVLKKGRGNSIEAEAKPEQAETVS